jgi:DNA-directed RNA polymerase specialized sigma24 family protein
MNALSVYKASPQTEQLIADIKRKDIPRFSLFYDAYAPVLYGWILTKTGDVATAEHILVKTFTSVWSTISQYDPNKCTFLIWLIQLSGRELRSLETSLPEIVSLKP